MIVPDIVMNLWDFNRLEKQRFLKWQSVNGNVQNMYILVCRSVAQSENWRLQEE